MVKVRVYEVAREAGMAPRDLVAKIRSLGIQIANHMSVLGPDEAMRVKLALERERQKHTVEARVGSTVIRRRSKRKKVAPEPPAPEQVAAAIDVAPAPKPAPAAKPVAKPKPAPKPAAPAPKPAPEVPVSAAPAPEAAPAAKPAAAKKEKKPAPAAKPAAEAKPAEPKEAAPPPVAAPAAAEPVAEKPAPAPAAAPEKQDEKLGPTGRFIDLKKTHAPRVIITDLGDRNQRGRGLTTRRDRRGPTGRHAAARGKGKRRVAAGKKQQRTEVTIPAAHKRRLRMEDAISLAELAKQMGIKATDALKKLWGLGMTGITINTTLDLDTAGVLASEFGFEVENVAFQEEELIKQQVDEEEDLLPRPPVVTIMGHVDHGKTSLLDAIRKSDIVSSESGGITQHIGAYKVKVPSGEIVFIDTPGHEAFSAMRARGANATDIVVLVVAADDGVMPQTREAIQHAQAAKVPILVAVNKIDKGDAQPDRVRQALTEHQLVPEAWGGDTIFCDVSAITKDGLDNLLEMINFQAELLELKANPKKHAAGVVLEAQLDKSRGPMVTVLVREGTLSTSDTVMAGEYTGRVRALIDDRGRQTREAGPSTPVVVLGMAGVPAPGDAFYQLKDEKDAKRIVSHRVEQRRRKELASAGPGNLLEKLARGEQKELKVVLKADQQGTAEAVKESLVKLGTDRIELIVVSAGVGAINESDINLARASDALVLGFHVRPTKQSRSLAEKENVQIKLYNVIYEMLDDVKDAMRGLLPKERHEKVVGTVEVRQTFTIPKIGTIAGSYVTDGKVNRNGMLRLVRDNVQIYEGRVSSLRRFKDDVKEVEKGYECGVGIDGYNDIKVGDVIEVYEIEERTADL